MTLSTESVGMAPLPTKSQQKQLNVAVGILIDEHRKLLLTKRQTHQPYADFWEFPGGKIEANETPVAGLARELSEELGVILQEATPLVSVQHVYPEYAVRLNVFWVKRYQGEIHGKEGQAITWCMRQQLHQFKLLPANEIILQALIDLELI